MVKGILLVGAFVVVAGTAFVLGMKCMSDIFEDD
jgi:hypothetical protein